MLSLLLPQLTALEAAVSEAAQISAYWYGGFALFVLVALLAVTVVLGKGRPHS